MNVFNPRAITIGTLILSTATCAFSVSYSSFNPWTSISGVHVMPSNNGIDNLVSLDAGAQMVYNGNTYTIVNIFAFFSLASTSSGNLGATGADNGIWKWNGQTNLAGWEENANHDTTSILPGGSFNFHYTAINFANVSMYGFHFTTKDVLGNIRTEFYKGNVGQTRVLTPEPVTSSLAAAGALAFIRRRRKAAK